jgi:predicted metal-dependent hydrolase
VDLYNFAYWWECHEIFEGFWRAADRKAEQGRFFQALIQVAAANLKVCMGSPSAAERLSAAAVQRFQTMPQIYMGIDIGVLGRDIRAYADGSRVAPALIRLQVSGDKPAVQIGSNRVRTTDPHRDNEQDLQR